MATLEVERAPAGSSCTRVRTVHAKYRGRHLDVKWRVVQGEGSQSNRTLCEACAKGAEPLAINRAEQRELDDEQRRIDAEREREQAAIAAEAERLRRGWWARYWPWPVMIGGGGFAILVTWWLVAGAIGLLTLAAFAVLVSVPCRSTVDVDPEPCEEWARGFLRACPDHKHAQRQHDLLLEAWRGNHRPRLIWDERMAKGAIAGAWVSLALIALASGCYLSTVWF